LTMAYFGRFYLDQEKDLIVTLDLEDGVMRYVLETPNHTTGNLITNLAKICGLPISLSETGMRIIEGTVPCYIDAYNREVYIFRLGNTKTASIYADGTIERKASIPAISKTLMSQTKNYNIDFEKTVVKTYIPAACKFRSDLHTHMNANLHPDLLIALGIHHQILYPLYYIKKLELKLNERQKRQLEQERERKKEEYRDLPLSGKYMDRKIDDNVYLNFADLILNNTENASYNIPRIRRSLAVMKDGQAVFTNLEKVYLYRYVFCRPVLSKEKIALNHVELIPDEDIVRALKQMEEDRRNPSYKNFTLFQDKLLWTARSYRKCGITYAEISDTSLVKKSAAPHVLKQIHEAMPAITEETGVTLRFLAALRRIPVGIGPEGTEDLHMQENLQVLKAVSGDPYVAGSDIVGEEINDIRELSSVIEAIVKIAADNPSFVIRIHAGENDSLKENVLNSILLVKESLEENQPFPRMRIGHGLYTPNLSSAKGKQLLKLIRENHVVLEFQITSNVRLNNLSALGNHPLKQYLSNGILCVQGTDGGALYGTNSIDEELSLGKLLDLSEEELLSMRKTEEEIIRVSMEEFNDKLSSMDHRNVEAYYAERIDHTKEEFLPAKSHKALLSSDLVLEEKMKKMPEKQIPLIIAGGSFNNDSHETRMKEEWTDLLDEILEKGDPEKMFFVVGHAMKAYEKYILDHNDKGFEVYAIVPALISEKEKEKIQDSEVFVRVSIIASAMGLYKSFYYEIFKRRPSVLLALDGNSAGMNLVQEAKNGKKKCRIFVNGKSRMLAQKARTLEGYAKLLKGDGSDGKDILSAVDEILQEGK